MRPSPWWPFLPSCSCARCGGGAGAAASWTFARPKNTSATRLRTYRPNPEDFQYALTSWRDLCCVFSAQRRGKAEGWNAVLESSRPGKSVLGAGCPILLPYGGVFAGCPARRSPSPSLFSGLPSERRSGGSQVFLGHRGPLPRNTWDYPYSPRFWANQKRAQKHLRGRMPAGQPDSGRGKDSP
jgi:hypothetical protein